VLQKRNSQIFIYLKFNLKLNPSTRAAAFALTISGCAAPEELTPTQSATSDPETTVEWYEDLAPQVTVGWNDIVDHFNGSTAAGNNVANSLIWKLRDRG